MYESYWNLSRKPFGGAQGCDEFFAGQSHQSAMLRLGYGLLNLSGPAMVLGLSGVGKSLLVRVFAKEHPRFSPLVTISFPSLRPDELLRAVVQELTGTPCEANAGGEQVVVQLRDALRKKSAAGQRTLLVFDDAHLISDHSLREVVLPLLNLTESDAAMELSVILIGQPVLSAQIRRHTPLAERVAVTTPITGWTQAETVSYIAQRLAAAGGRAEIFSTAALNRLHEVTTGNPRRVNRLADMALVVGFADSLSQITDAEIDAIASELLPAAA